MEKKTSLQNLLAQLNAMIDVIKTRTGPIEMKPDLVEDIKKLEAVVTDFKNKNEEVLSLFTEGKKQEKDTFKSDEPQNNDELPVQMNEEMIEEQIIKLSLSKKETKKKKKSPDDQPPNHEKLRMKERRKMFKTIGGDQKWIPL